MNPLRTPALVRGDIPEILRRGTPVYLPQADPDRPALHADKKGLVDDRVTEHSAFVRWNGASILDTDYLRSHLALDWEDSLTISVALQWLAVRGHPMGWALPLPHGGQILKAEGLSSWEISAILVSHNVARIVAGKPPLSTMVRAYGVPTNARLAMDHVGHAEIYWTATEVDRDHWLAPTRLGHDTHLTPDHPGWLYTPREGFTSYGPEVGVAAVEKINACLLADNHALLVPGGVVVPE